MYRKILATLAAAIVAIGLAVAPASPAQAAYSACNAGEFCLWPDPNGNGSGWARQPGQLTSCVSLVGSSVGNDNAESVRNRLNSAVDIFEHANCTGTRYQILPYGMATTGYNLGAFPNQTSGVRLAQQVFKYAGAFQNQAAGVSTGVRAQCDVRAPHVDTYSYHSLCEVAAQSADGNQVVEVGWTVDRNVNGDNDPHLFAFNWVNDVPGCYNGCGYVDNAANPVDAGDTLAIADDKLFVVQFFPGAGGTGKWWLYYDTDWIGYFPESEYAAAVPPVTFVDVQLTQVFGEVAAALDNPCTDMGNGTAGTSVGAAEARNIQYMNSGGAWTNMDMSLTQPTPTLYSSAFINAAPDRNDFRFGGGGVSSPATC